MSRAIGRLEVWAPHASSVEALIESADGRSEIERRPMSEVGDGWWAAQAELAPGTDYRFSIDSGPGLPDPRSRWQPAGIDGPSRTIDPAAFLWHDRDWQPPPLESGLIYEAHVGTFSAEGTFDGAIDHLDHLVELGVTHLELMPLAEFPGERGWGYDGVDLYAPHHSYGGPEGLARLVDACHQRGLAVILDVVYNHLGPAGNYLARFGPYFSDRYRTPWGDAVNLDAAGSDHVRRFFVDNALMWLRDYHLDGLRVDAVHAIFDMSAVHFLEQLASEVHELGDQLGRRLLVIAESDLNDPRLVRPVAAGGYGLDAQWSDDFHHALHTVLSGETSGYYADFGSLDQLATTLRQGYCYAGDYSVFRQRRHGRPSPDLDGQRLVGYLQNHDQIGNRALGERSGALMSPGRLMIGAAVVLTAPFVPLLFQGEEWAAGTPFLYFTHHHDPDLAAAVSHGRRAEFAAFGWQPELVPDPQAAQTFERSRLDWSEPAMPEHARVLGWYRDLVQLRATFPELRDGRLDAVAVRHDALAGWLVYTRGRVTLAFNTATQPRLVTLPGSVQEMHGSSDDIALHAQPPAVELPPDSVAVLVMH